MGETEQKMSEHPSISFLKEKHAKPKSEQNLTTEAVEKLLKTYEEKLSQACEKVKILPMGYVDTQMLSETITEAVEGYRQTINFQFPLLGIFPCIRPHFQLHLPIGDWPQHDLRYVFSIIIET